MVHHNTCSLCLSSRIVSHLQTTDHFLSRESFELFRCPDCGFIFTQDHPDEKNIGKYYESENYISHNESAKGFSSWLYRFSRNLMVKKKKEIVSRFTRLNGGRILDIGSGNGFFLSVIKDSGWIAEGIEINDKARNYSASRFGLKIIPPDQISSVPSASYDCITMWHALEHFEDPIGLASEIKRILKPGGSFIVALPNCSSFDGMYYKNFWAAYDVPRHLWHFTPPTFKMFAEKTGFQIKKIQSLPLDVFYICILSEKYKGSGFHFLKGIIKGKWFFTRTIFNKEKSSSLIYFLREKV